MTFDFLVAGLAEEKRDISTTKNGGQRGYGNYVNYQEMDDDLSDSEAWWPEDERWTDSAYWFGEHVDEDLWLVLRLY